MCVFWLNWQIKYPTNQYILSHRCKNHTNIRHPVDWFAHNNFIRTDIYHVMNFRIRIVLLVKYRSIQRPRVGVDIVVSCYRLCRNANLDFELSAGNFVYTLVCSDMRAVSYSLVLLRGFYNCCCYNKSLASFDQVIFMKRKKSSNLHGWCSSSSCSLSIKDRWELINFNLFSGE